MARFRDGVIRAGCSLARGGGKTGMASQICLDGLRPSGALHRPGLRDCAGGEFVFSGSDRV